MNHLKAYCLSCKRERLVFSSFLAKACGCGSVGIEYRFEPFSSSTPTSPDRGDDNFLEPVHDYGVQEV